MSMYEYTCVDDLLLSKDTACKNVICYFISRTALSPTLRLPEDQLAWTDNHEYEVIEGENIANI